VYFQTTGEQKSLSSYERLLFQCKKRSFKSKVQCPIKNELFSNEISEVLFQQIRRNTRSETFPPSQLLNSCLKFLKDNNLIVKNADKNAGICIISKQWYDAEIYRQLLDESIYRPSCELEYTRAMDELADQCKHLKLDLGSKIKIHNILIQNPKPASFYLLPKVHKSYEKFPPGRPISSTCNSINRNISALVDFILKPMAYTLPGILIDTTHFLHVLHEVQLDPLKKYSLLTYDIDSMYTNLNVNRCKYFCMKEFRKYKEQHKLLFELSENDMKRMLNMSLDYSYLKYDNDFFIQSKGIQMGNCASVSIANITAYHELKNMFVNKSEIKENVRFVDDGFMIVETTNIINLDVWIKNLFKHKYLTFTVQHSPLELNFLDVTVRLTDNVIYTSLYKKPMNKCMYLSYFSNHPKHLLRSLPYSQGLRVKRICSDANESVVEISKIMMNFKKRGYPQEILNQCIGKLNNLERYDLLKPKSKYLIQNLSIFHPNILSRYNIYEEPTTQHVNLSNANDFYVVIPFYSNVFRLKQIVSVYLSEEIEKCHDSTLKNILKSMSIHIVYSVNNKLENKLNP